MIFPPEPTKGDDILSWSQAVQRVIRDFDRRLNSIVLPRPKAQVTNASKATPRKPLEVRLTTDENGDPALRIYLGMVGTLRAPDLGFSIGDNPPLLLPVDTGDIRVKYIIDPETGDTLSGSIDFGDEDDDPDEGEYYIWIASVDASGDVPIIAQYGYGPVNTIVSRLWYRAEAPFFTLNYSYSL